MPGPNSAPNGAAALVADMRKVYCPTHGRTLRDCTPACRPWREREVQARRGTLRTGKTAAKRLGR